MRDSARIVVIGGGIIGASIAWHLIEAGASVTLIANAAGGIATPRSFAWINASWGNPLPYFRLRTKSMAGWKRLASSVPAIELDWNGGLIWDLPADELRTYAEQHSSWGYGLRHVDAAEALRLEPSLVDPPEFALHVAEEGAVEPLSATNALLEDAVRKGLLIIHDRVLSLKANGGRIEGVITANGLIETRQVVVAAGAGSTEILGQVGIDLPIQAPPGLIVHSNPVAPTVNGLVLAPELHVRQTRQGRLIAGSDFAGTDPGKQPERAAAELFGKLKDFLKIGEDLTLDYFTIGYRPTPQDGFPLVGAFTDIAGVYVAVTHSGITLAPIIGESAAREIMLGEKEPLLTPYRPDRCEQRPEP